MLIGRRMNCSIRRLHRRVLGVVTHTQTHDVARICSAFSVPSTKGGGAFRWVERVRVVVGVGERGEGGLGEVKARAGVPG